MAAHAPDPDAAIVCGKTLACDCLPDPVHVVALSGMFPHAAGPVPSPAIACVPVMPPLLPRTAELLVLRAVTVVMPIRRHGTAQASELVPHPSCLRDDATASPLPFLAYRHVPTLPRPNPHAQLAAKLPAPEQHA